MSNGSRQKFFYDDESGDSAVNLDGVYVRLQGTSDLGGEVASIVSLLSGAISAASATSTNSTNLATATTASVPGWIGKLGTALLVKDMTAADVNGVATAAGLAKLLTDLDSLVATQKTGLTGQQFADLKTIAANLNNGLSTSAYLTYAFNALANGNAANATWTGGAASSVALGNLAIGASATKLSELTGKWFLGTDLPSSKVAMSGYSPFTVSYSTVGKPLFASTGPGMNDINQGYLGDCYFLSSCADVANERSASIKSMIADNGNGAYGVRLYYKGQAEYVTVNASLANGGSIFNHAADLWAGLLEKAYAQFQAGGLETGNSVNYGNSYSTIGNGGMPADALEALTGATAFDNFYAHGSTWGDYRQNASLAYTSSSSGLTTAGVLKAIVADLNAHDDVILSSYTNAKANGVTTLVADHAMSIYGYDSTTGNLDIRNPWGSAPGQTWATTFEVSLATLLADGDMITVDNAGGMLASATTSSALASSIAAATHAMETTPFSAIEANMAQLVGAASPSLAAWHG